MARYLKILPRETVQSLQRVRRTEKVSVGTFFALRGAWDNKKVAISMRPIFAPNRLQYQVRRADPNSISGLRYVYETIPHQGMVEVELVNVGRIFSDGRWVVPTRPSPPVKLVMVKVDGKWYPNNNFRRFYSTGYWPVEPIPNGKREPVVAVTRKEALKIGRQISDAQMANEKEFSPGRWDW